MMRFKIFHKLLTSLVLMTTLALLSLAGLSWYMLDRGFTAYLMQQDLERQRKLVGLLEIVYGFEGSWAFLEGSPRRWGRLIGLAEGGNVRNINPRAIQEELAGLERPPGRRHGPPGERRPPFQRGPRDGKRPFPPPPQHSPLGARLSLYDMDHIPIFGKDPLKETSEGTRHEISHNGAVVGYLFARESHGIRATRDLAFLKEQTRTIVLITLALIALATLVAIFLARHLGKPITSLALGARRLSAGAYNTRVRFESNDELGTLARDFNNLAHALEQNEAARQRWTADISHELRTPLAVLRGELEALRDGVRPVNDKTLASLHSEVLYLGKLVNDLYDLSLADIGALTYQKSTIDVFGVFEQVAESFRSRLDSKHLQLLATPNHGNARILGDHNRLRQLFTNLLENACRYTDDGGRIQASTSVGEGCLKLVLEDSAPAPADCTRLFERFHREDRARSRANGGAGLGMAICKAIIDAHDGEVKASVSSLGGLRLEIDLPLE